MLKTEAAAHVRRFLTERREEILDLACDLIRTGSENPPGDERAAARLVVERLHRCGVQDTRIISLEPHRPNIIATVHGRGAGPTMMLNGHLDTKPPGDVAKWQTPYLEPAFRDGKIHGLGACDMKGAVAAMVYAAAAIQGLPEPLPGSLELVLTADEEAGSKFGAEYVAREGGLAADAGLIAEPSGVRREWEALCLLSRGVCALRIHVWGDQTHSSLTDLLPARNASIGMAKILARFRDELRLTYPPHPLCPGGPTINPGVMVNGGVFFGVCPGHAEFAVDIRVLPGMTKEGVLRDVEAFLEQVRAEDPALEVTVESAPPPLDWIEPAEIRPDHPLVAATLDAAEQVLGHRPPLGAFPGGTDAGFFQHITGIPMIPSFGPGFLTFAHSPNEHIQAESICEAAEIYALTALQYLSQRR